uniref:EamA family transporter RarD n=1 Tax=Georgenia subflava TaxID=1622177 RepID=UPI001D02D898|nr:EamA family transporter RarD [Georgenia subflava]
MRLPSGVLLSVLASVMFGVLYFLPARLGLTGEEFYGWRVLLTVPLVAVLLAASGRWRTVREMAGRIRARPGVLGRLAATAALLGPQLWLFSWAPNNGHALEVALGYFLMPLVMVVIGLLLHGERLSRLRVLAVLCAVVGVGNELLRVGALSWSTVLVALGYPAYFELRRRLGTATTGGMWFELVLMLPVAGWFLLTGPTGGAAVDRTGLLVLMGLLSATALVCYLVASQVLSFSLFGLLSYVEPVCLALVSVVLLHEAITAREWFTYGPIWAAVALLVLEGAAQARRMRGLRAG